MKKTTFISTILLLGISLLEANVNGMVFKELPVDGNKSNTYGNKDVNEKGISGVTVTAYPENLSTTTDDNGNWSLATNAANIRIEFTNWSPYLQESAIGTQNNSSVQFIKNNGTANLALHNPDDFVDSNPLLTTTHFVNGKSALNLAEPTIFSWPITNEGKKNPNQVTLSKTDDLRSAWGLAYDKTNKKLYSSTLLKRHVSIGVNTLGTIYITELEGNTTKVFTSIDAGTIVDGTRGLDEANKPNTDASTLSMIAKVGLGDIDVSEDKSTLYVVNLFDKKIYEINTETGTVNKSYSVPGPTCNNGELRPFAVTQHEDALFVGTVCDASTSNCVVKTKAGYCEDLTAQVYKLALGETTGTEIFKMRLDYKKEYIHQPQQYDPTRFNWNPWTDKYEELVHSMAVKAKRVFHPTPILSNIKFDESNNMFLAFADRSTIQTGARQNDINGIDRAENIVMSGGDILKAKLENNSSYTLLDHNLYDDNTSTTDTHAEGALGAVTYIQGSNEIAFTEYDAFDSNGNGKTFDTKGVTFNNATTGKRTKSYEVAGVNLTTYFGKGTSIGDLEIITSAAPTQIGNRLWLDDNNNCTQDANESGIDGVKIQLIDENNIVIDEENTSNGGYYSFSNIIPNKNYTVRIDDVNQTQLTTRELSTNCAGVNNLINNDATLNGNYADITVNASDIHFAGANNYSFDFGFHPKNIIVVPTPTYSLGNYVWLDTNHDGIQDTNETGIKDINVTLYSTADCSGDVVTTTTTDNDGKYLFENLNTGDYCVRFDLPTDYTVSPQNAGADDAVNSDADTSGLIKNINLTADTLEEDVGIYPSGVVEDATINHTDGTCACHPYKEKSVDAFNIYALLIMMLLTSFIATSNRKEA